MALRDPCASMDGGSPHYPDRLLASPGWTRPAPRPHNTGVEGGARPPRSTPLDSIGPGDGRGLTVQRLHRPCPGFPGRASCLGAALATLVLTLSFSQGLRAQGADLNRIEPGDSVRIQVSERQRVAAEFHAWGRDRILLDVHGFVEPYPVAVEDMEQMDAYLLRTSRESFRHGALLGAAGGLFIGAAVGLVLHTTGVIDDPDEPAAEIVTDTMQWMGLGLVGGALFGGFWSSAHPGFGWIRIELPAS